MSHCSSMVSAGTCSWNSSSSTLAQVPHHLADILRLEHLVAQLVDFLALVVGDVIVLQQLLRMSKLRLFHLRCADSIERVTMPASIGSPSGIFSRSMIARTRSPAKMRSSWSSSDR